MSDVTQKYTIGEINDEDCIVVVIFDFDSSVHKIANAPISDVDALKQFISEYLAAYKSGKALETAQATDDVKALIGKKFEAEQSTES